jgi:hypothetical protein
VLDLLHNNPDCSIKEMVVGAAIFGERWELQVTCLMQLLLPT